MDIERRADEKNWEPNGPRIHSSSETFLFSALATRHTDTSKYARSVQQSLFIHRSAIGYLTSLFLSLLSHTCYQIACTSINVHGELERKNRLFYVGGACESMRALLAFTIHQYEGPTTTLKIERWRPRRIPKVAFRHFIVTDLNRILTDIGSDFASVAGHVQIRLRNRFDRETSAPCLQP